MLQNLKVLNYDYITRRKQDEKFTQSNCPCEHRSYYGFWLIDPFLLVCGPMGEIPSVLISQKNPKQASKKMPAFLKLGIMLWYSGCSGWHGASYSSWLASIHFGFPRGEDGVFAFERGYWYESVYCGRGVAVVGTGL